MTDSFGWTVGSAPISWKNFFSASAHSGSLASSHSGIGTTMLGSSWATRAAARVGVRRAAERHQDDVDRPDVAELLLGQLVADVAEMDRVQPVDLHDEGDLLAARRALGIVAIGADAGHEDVLDLVLARAVEDERVVQARRQEGVAVARRLALRARQPGVVGMAEGDDVAGDPPAGRADDRLVGVRHDDRVAAAKADAGPSVPGDFHRPDSDTARCIAAYVWRPVRGSPEKRRPEAPAQSAPPVGGREDGTLRVRPTTTLRRTDSATRWQAVKKAIRIAGPPHDPIGTSVPGTIGRWGESQTSATIRR